MSRPHYMTPELWVQRRRAYASFDANGCLVWKGNVNSWGYAQSSYNNKTVRVHRQIFELVNGPIATGLVVCHSCDNPRCIHLDHLFLGTVKDNKHDEMRKGRNFYLKKTHCPRGHSYEEHGVRVSSGRHCSVCSRARHRLRAGWPEALAYSAAPLSRKACVEMRWQKR